MIFSELMYDVYISGIQFTSYFIAIYEYKQARKCSVIAITHMILHFKKIV